MFAVQAVCTQPVPTPPSKGAVPHTLHAGGALLVVMSILATVYLAGGVVLNKTRYGQCTPLLSSAVCPTRTTEPLFRVRCALHICMVPNCTRAVTLSQ